MSLRWQFYGYIAALHLGLLAFVIWHRQTLGWLLIPCELLLLLSFLVGARLLRLIEQPVKAARSLVDAIKSGALGARCASVGHREIDSILATYNDMLATLQRAWLGLGEQRGFLERFLAVTPIGVIIFDFEGRISVCNERSCKFLDIQHDVVIGRALTELKSRLARGLVDLDAGATRMLTDATGRRLLCRRGEFQDRGFARSYLLIEELTAELNRTERDTYEKLVRMVSHEVTNTVTATNSLLESCRSYSAHMGTSEDRADYLSALDVIIARNSNLNAFMEGCSEVLRLPAPNRQQMHVAELLSAMSTMFRAELEQRQIQLVVRVPPNLPTVSMDRNQMDRVMINVIRNAIEAVERGGTIELTATGGRDSVELAVIDNGCGLQADADGRLFAPFYTTKSYGQGLGLMLVKEILVTHGFPFSLSSSAGRTHFVIRMSTVSETSLHLPEIGVRVPRDVVSE
jgi:two-component system, NtrC family, nitrogen regulation sensor histidine kinase NtrY